MTSKQQLEWAIQKWSEAAISGASNPAYAASCDRTVKALQLELETGVAHCNCHLQPWEDCTSRIRSAIV